VGVVQLARLTIEILRGRAVTSEGTARAAMEREAPSDFEAMILGAPANNWRGGGLETTSAKDRQCEKWEARTLSFGGAAGGGAEELSLWTRRQGRLIGEK